MTRTDDTFAKRLGNLLQTLQERRDPRRADLPVRTHGRCVAAVAEPAPVGGASGDDRSGRTPSPFRDSSSSGSGPDAFQQRLRRLLGESDDECRGSGAAGAADDDAAPPAIDDLDSLLHEV